MSFIERLVAAARGSSTTPPPVCEGARMTGVLEQLVAHVAELRQMVIDGNAHVLRELGAVRGDVEALGHTIAGAAARALDAGEVAHRVSSRVLNELSGALVERVSARAADEVREQVEAILATAVADETPRPELGQQVPIATPTPHLEEPPPEPPKKRRQRVDTLPAAIARALDTIEREPSRTWKPGDLREAARITSVGTWSRVATRLASHPAVVVERNKGSRTYRAARRGERARAAR